MTLYVFIIGHGLRQLVPQIKVILTALIRCLTLQRTLNCLVVIPPCLFSLNVFFSRYCASDIVVQRYL